MRSIETSSWCGVKAGQLGGRVKLRGTIDVVTLQILARRDDIASLTAGFGLIVADECLHVPAAAFADAVKQIPVRRWLGLTATPYRRDKLDDLIAMQVGPGRHTITGPREAAHGTPTLPGTTPGRRPGSRTPPRGDHDLIKSLASARPTGVSGPVREEAIAALDRSVSDSAPLEARRSL